MRGGHPAVELGALPPGVQRVPGDGDARVAQAKPVNSGSVNIAGFWSAMPTTSGGVAARAEPAAAIVSARTSSAQSR